MRGWTAVAFLSLLVASSASAQASNVQARVPQAPAAEDGALDPDSYVALSADQQAQLTLGGFRGYLERIRPTDGALYAALDPQLDELESRETVADIIFWTGTGLGVAALLAAIPVYTLMPDLDPGVTIGLVVGGLTTFLVGVIVQAIVRPGHGDLMRLIDAHDRFLGHR